MHTDLTDTDAMKMAEDMADAVYANARRTMPKVETKPCPRCDGRGSIKSQFHVEHGRCFKCNWTGTVAATKAGRDAIALHFAKAEVERLRILWRGHYLAAAMLRGGMTTARFGIEMEIRQHERQMAQIVDEGKAAKARAVRVAIAFVLRHKERNSRA